MSACMYFHRCHERRAHALAFPVHRRRGERAGPSRARAAMVARSGARARPGSRP